MSLAAGGIAWATRDRRRRTPSDSCGGLAGATEDDLDYLLGGAEPEPDEPPSAPEG